MVTVTYYLTEAEKNQAAKKISEWLDLDTDEKSMHGIKEIIAEFFPGCESLYISLQLNDIVEHAELDNQKIPRFLIDIVGIELFEGKHGKKIRELMLKKIYAKDHWILRKIERQKIEASEWNLETAKRTLEHLISKNWTPGGGWARQFVTVLGFPMKFSGIASPPEPVNLESVEKRVHLDPLQPFQDNLKKQILELIKKHDSLENRCILRLPTGAGKTRTAAEAIIEYWKTKPEQVRWVVWIAHTEELCEQALQCFRQLWEEFGEEASILNIHRVWGGKPLPDPNDDGIIIAGIDQLYHLIPKGDEDPREDEISRIADDVGLVVVDEAHHSIAPSYTLVLKSFGITKFPTDSKQKPLVGLTATPFRTSDLETEQLLRKYGNHTLWPSFDDRWREWEFVVGKLTADNILSKPHFHYLRTDSVFQMDGAETDYLKEKNLLPQKLLDRVGRNTKRNLEVFNSIKGWAAKGRTILFFGASLNQAMMISKFLNDNNIKSAVITGETRYGTRQSYVKMFKEKKIQVLCNYQVLTTGFDAPKVDTVIIARPTGSRSLYEQMIGRGLRGTKFGGTEECDIITVIDNILNYEKKRIKLGYEEYAESVKEGMVDEERKKIITESEKFPAAEEPKFREPTVPEPGEVFTEDHLYDRFHVQTSGGIRFTKLHNTVLLIDSDLGHYDDRVDEKSGIITYTGTGESDQDFDFGMGKFNARVRDSENSTLLYFHKPERNRVIFKYPVKFDSFYFDTEKNLQGRERKVIKFRLRIIKSQCPSCHKIASTDEEVEKMFGYRNMNGTVRTQSWCRDCRKTFDPSR